MYGAAPRCRRTPEFDESTRRAEVTQCGQRLVPEFKKYFAALDAKHEERPAGNI
jgi:hypothetical protein